MTLGFSLFVQQLGYRVLSTVSPLRWVQIKNEPVPELCDRFQRKYLGQDFLLQVNDQSHHVRTVLSDPYRLNIRIVRCNFGDQVAQGAIQVDTLYIHDQTIRIVDDKVIELQVVIVLQRDPGIFTGWPDPNSRHYGGTRAERQDRKKQAGPGAMNQASAGIERLIW